METLIKNLLVIRKNCKKSLMIVSILILISLFLTINVYAQETSEEQKDNLVGYSIITINEAGIVELSVPIYESDIEETPGLPVYRYISNIDGEVVQVKSYMYSKQDRKYILDYIINVDENRVILARVVFTYRGSKRLVDYIEYYYSGKLEKIEYYEDGTKLVSIERFDQTGDEASYSGKEEIVYIDPYGFYDTFTFMEDGELSGYSVYYPNDELLLQEQLVESSTGNTILVFDKNGRTRTIKSLDDDGRVIKEEVYSEKGILVFYREIEYSGDDYSKITIYEEIEMLIDNKYKMVNQIVIFYFENGELVTRERYLDDELISSTSYSDNSSTNDDIKINNDADTDEDSGTDEGND